jgi:TatD DNase family protein
MELIDTHCHLTFKPLADEIDAVLERSQAAGVTGWITVGTDEQENQRVVELANSVENMYAAIGIHPHEAEHVTTTTLNSLKELAKNKKVAAIGETGLDFHYNFSQPQQQKEVFIEHLHIAGQLGLPVIIHSREAFDETMKILEQHGGKTKVVFHCFGGSAQQAKIVLDHGFYISFTGAVTFKNAHLAREAAKTIPLDRLMIETDCPYMSPEPMRKQKINEPALMIHTAKKLAELKGIELTQLAKETAAASRTFFGLPAKNAR